LDELKTIKLFVRKIEIKRVAVVEFGMYQGGGDD
jgi:hypothetical protein